MTSSKLLIALVLAIAVAPSAMAQNRADRAGTWEFVFEANYQDAYRVNFEGGSFAETDDDLGFTLGGTYHLNNRLSLQFLFDWLNVDYDATIMSGDTPPNPAFDVRGEMESFTPRFNAVFNFLESDFTPYVSAGIGWAFIDTNIPQGPPQTGCWWDPWWGYICQTYQNTRDLDEFTYQAGAGVRWDVNRGLSLRLGYEKQWIDVGTATSTPGFDVIHLGIGYKY
ncbi:MAG TPA: outer membrane beta-barrel protein [Steroidobacteraceae bacterium]|nr:outer membrane beta-barrel protein [Steroidobacteraceae bacterium]